VPRPPSRQPRINIRAPVAWTGAEPHDGRAGAGVAQPPDGTEAQPQVLRQLLLRQ
jgi:hypothetical protein